VSHFQAKGFDATGTLRANRVPKGIGCVNKNDVKKLARGSTWEFCSDDGIQIVQWKDNSLVTLASNSFNYNPIGTMQRYDSTKHKKVGVKCPQSILKYNTHMGYVDRMEQEINKYRISMRGKHSFSI
jgi:hypothetical protein